MAQKIIDNAVATPLFGEGQLEESQDSSIIFELLPPEMAVDIWRRLESEIEWTRMLHQSGEVPRLVCCQATISSDDSVPIYRHPADKTILAQPWTATVDMIRRHAEKQIGHELNHALVQKYRDGCDFISEHSDKTLDISPNTNIVNISFGAERTMRLRTKRVRKVGKSAEARTTHRVRMPHNSMLVMSLKTNAKFMHGINADKRRKAEMSDAELAFEGQRISLTFRKIATFTNHDASKIWGQGAVGKSRISAQDTVTGQQEESRRLLEAFGAENQSSEIAWEAWYGIGSNVLHLT